MTPKVIKTTEVSITKLKPAEYNPRKISDFDFENLKRGMELDGCIENIVVNKDMTIISGHQRVKAATALGWDKIPAVVLDVPKAYEKALNIRMNRVRGEFDELLLGELVISLASNPELDMSLTGLSDNEISEFLDATKEPLPDTVDDLKEIEKQIVSVKRGDIIQLGEHRLMCGDSTNPDDVAKLMNGEKARILFTDPPYNVAYEASVEYGDKSNIENDSMSDPEYREFCKKFMACAVEHTVENALFYVWHGDKYTDMIKTVGIELGLKWKQNIMWLKESPTFGFGRLYMRLYELALIMGTGKKPYTNGYTANFKDVYSKHDFMDMLDVWYARRDNSTDYVHPTQKPTILADRAIRKHTKPGDVVMDLFGGSGSTLIAAEHMGRKAYVMEYDPYFAETIANRYRLFVSERDSKDDNN